MPKKSVSPRSTNQVDYVIATRLRAKREELGLSQQALAKLVGITFQQIQKYEKASNRIAASRLFALAAVLDVRLDYFFEPLKDQSAPSKVMKRPAAKKAAIGKANRHASR